MWKQQQPEQRFAEYPDLSEKLCQESAAGDSGFVSSGYVCSSEFSSNSLVEDKKLVSIDSPKPMDSGIDFGLSDSLKQLSLKQTFFNQFDSGNVNSECMLESTSSNDKSGNMAEAACSGTPEACQEPWQLYFTQNDDGDTLLHAAVIQGFFEAALSLINSAPDSSLLDILNDDNQTALHLAVVTNQPKVVRRLVLAGADLSVRNYQGNTALHLACMAGNLECAKALTQPIGMNEETMLLSQSLPTIPQNLEQRNYHGETCLHVAASRDHVDLVRLLVELGSELDAQESLGGRTALHLALERGCFGVVVYLLRECQPHLDAPTYSGCTAYQIASCVDEQLARELVSLGATPVRDEQQQQQTDEFREVAGFVGAAAARA